MEEANGYLPRKSSMIGFMTKGKRYGVREYVSTLFLAYIVPSLLSDADFYSWRWQDRPDVRFSATLVNWSD